MNIIIATCVISAIVLYLSFDDDFTLGLAFLCLLIALIIGIIMGLTSTTLYGTMMVGGASTRPLVEL